jgi:hypothetical protein
MATEFILMGQILTLVGGIKNAIQEFETKKNKAMELIVEI